MTAVQKIPDSHWWLSGGVAGANFGQAWRFADGQGVIVGMIDDPVNAGHVDLGGTVNSALALPDMGVTLPGTIVTGHGTQVAGLIGGIAGNQSGGMGAAPSAVIAPSVLRLHDSLQPAELARLLAGQMHVDVSNNSWGVPGAFADSFHQTAYHAVELALQQAVTLGRGGLGTNIVFAAGNGKLMAGGGNQGDDTNFHSLASSRMTIAVGATDATGGPAFFSTPGASLLLSAPGQGLTTANGQDAGASGSATVSGTSFAAPLVTSAIALILQVNPNLGYRDVQDILAISARPSTRPDAVANGAGHVNGGGLVFDRAMGFGRLDAEAAVRLARHWTAQSTAQNEQHVGGALIRDDAADQVRLSLTMGESPFDLDWVELTLSLTDPDLRHLRIEVISPAGTHSVIIENMLAAGGRITLSHCFSSAQYRGEDVGGTWQVILSHPTGGGGLAVADARLDFFGDVAGVDDTQYVTRAFRSLAQQDPDRLFLRDTDGGRDTINFAAAGAAVEIDLDRGRGHTQGHDFRSSGYEAVIGSSQGDVLRGNAGRNTLTGDGGRDNLWGKAGGDSLRGDDGADRLYGGAGNDVLTGGAGCDTLRGGGGADTFVLEAVANQADRIVDFEPGRDRLVITEAETTGSVHYSRATGQLWFDPVEGGSFLLAQCAPGLTLSAADYILI